MGTITLSRHASSSHSNFGAAGQRGHFIIVGMDQQPARQSSTAPHPARPRTLSGPTSQVPETLLILIFLLLAYCENARPASEPLSFRVERGYNSVLSGSIQVDHTEMYHLLPVSPVPSLPWSQGWSSTEVEHYDIAFGNCPVRKVQKGDPCLSPCPLPGPSGASDFPPCELIRGQSYSFWG